MPSRIQNVAQTPESLASAIATPPKIRIAPVPIVTLRLILGTEGNVPFQNPYVNYGAVGLMFNLHCFVRHSLLYSYPEDRQCHLCSNSSLLLALLGWWPS
jgi:hypothetical protein